MTNLTKPHGLTTIAQDTANVFQKLNEFKLSISHESETNISYLRNFLSNISQPVPNDGPMSTRTRRVPRNQTIPENEMVNYDREDMSVSSTDTNNEDKENTVAANRPRRKVSKRKDSVFVNETQIVRKTTRGSRLKRSLSPDEDMEMMRPPKLSKIKARKESAIDKDAVPPEVKEVTPNQSPMSNGVFSNPPNSVAKDDETFIVPASSAKNRSSGGRKNPQKATPRADETYAVNNMEKNFEENSIYEDAIGKPLPIGNSTMMPSSVAEMNNKLRSVSVVLVPLQMPIQMNATVTIDKRSSDLKKLIPNKNSNSTYNLESVKSRQKKLNKLEDLITDDESDSSVECKTPNHKRKILRNAKKKIVQNPIMTDDEDEIPNTPIEVQSRTKTGTVISNKNLRKPGILFSPFAKESVKKRVEAFEQVTNNFNTPNSGDEKLPGRLTRTKTRALAAEKAANSSQGLNNQVSSQSNVQQLARKSLSKAKEILLAKQLRENEEKEVKETADKKKKLLSEKAQKIWRTNSMDRPRIPVPINRNHTPKNHAFTDNTKALTGPRSKIITSIESFINPQRVINPPNTVDKMEEKKRKLMNDEDARKRREEALKLQMEEKKRKRQEKELKNKLAREAKEKLEMEKRLKAEKEREEKARSAQQNQEKLKEETEKRRLAHLQRAQEIEERRRQEEQLRLRRLQEQEETERLLMEQRRKEQEVEKRKEAEARAIQHNVEGQKSKYQTNAGHSKKEVENNLGPTSYVLDSDPDEEESDHESQPKHSIPFWAHPRARQGQLAMQRYIPQKKIFEFFGSRECTPDLSELFVGIEKSRLKRTSSAIWKTPPRFSIMERSILEP